jgi:hypothetical protein
MREAQFERFRTTVMHDDADGCIAKDDCMTNLCCKAKCADGLSRETLNASNRDTVDVEVTADRVESAGTLLRASKTRQY